MINIYSIRNSIYVISDLIIEHGNIKVFKKEGQKIFESDMINTNYEKFSLDIPKGNYLVKFDSSTESSAKWVYLF